MRMKRRTTVCCLATLLPLFMVGAFGCQTDQSQEDPNRTYFDGGALQDPEPMTIVLTGRVLKSQGRVVEAEYILRRAMVEYPAFGPTYSELGELLLKDGRTGEAISVLEVGITELPKDALLHNDLGICLVVAGEFKRAADEFTSARNLVPTDATYTANLAMVMGLMGEYDAAIALYLEVIPTVEAHENVAVLAEARGDLGRAETDRAIAKRAAE